MIQVLRQTGYADCVCDTGAPGDRQGVGGAVHYDEGIANHIGPKPCAGMGTCVHFSRSLPSNSWWQTMAGWQVLSRPSAAEGGGRRPAFTGLATQPYSATEVDGWQHKLSRVSQNRAAVQP